MDRTGTQQGKPPSVTAFLGIWPWAKECSGPSVPYAAGHASSPGHSGGQPCHLPLSRRPSSVTNQQTPSPRPDESKAHFPSAGRQTPFLTFSHEGKLCFVLLLARTATVSLSRFSAASLAPTPSTLDVVSHTDTCTPPSQTENITSTPESAPPQGAHP